VTPIYEDGRVKERSMGNEDRQNNCHAFRCWVNCVPWLLIRLMLLGLAMFNGPAQSQQKSDDLENQSLEDPMNVEMTSVSRLL